jgi:hypothetical protein
MIACAATALLIVAQQARPTTDGEKLEITAFAVNMSNVGTGATATVNFTINQWSPPDERERLIAMELEKGQDALLEELQRLPSHGRMWFPDWRGPDPTNARLGWDLRYTEQSPLPEGGQRIVILMDRHIPFWEVVNRPRVYDYPFTLAEMHVDRNGVGEGKLSVATKISFDRNKNVIELENYASEPVRLQNVRVKQKT